MKRITLLTLIIVALAAFKTFAGNKTASDTTGVIVAREALLTQLSNNAAALEQRFNASLTKEQREIMDAQKATVVQYNTIKVILSANDSTLKVTK